MTEKQARNAVINVVKNVTGISNVADVGKTAPNVIKLISVERSRAQRFAQLKQVVEILKTLDNIKVSISQKPKTISNVRLSGAGYAEIVLNNITLYLTISVETASYGFKLNPNSLSVTSNNYMDFNTFEKKIISGLENNEKIPDDLKLFLLELYEKVKNNDNTVLENSRFFDDKYKAMVDSQFGEILGPLIVANKWKGKFSGTVTIDKVNFPISETAGLYDFSILANNGYKTYFSSKAGSGVLVNTVKPQDIVESFKTQPGGADKNKYQKTTEYKIIEILANNSIRDGGRIAVNTFPEYFKYGMQTALSKYGENYIWNYGESTEPEIVQYIKNNKKLPEYPDDKDRSDKVAFYAERIIDEETKNSSEKKRMLGQILAFSMNRTFLYYVKFNLVKRNKDYTWESEIINPSVFSENDSPEIYIRGKGVRRPKERMGLTPP